MAVSCCCALQHILKCKMETKVFVKRWTFVCVFDIKLTLLTNCLGASDNRYPAWLWAIFCLVLFFTRHQLPVIEAANGDPTPIHKILIIYLTMAGLSRICPSGPIVFVFLLYECSRCVLYKRNRKMAISKRLRIDLFYCSTCRHTSLHSFGYRRYLHIYGLNKDPNKFTKAISTN